MLQNARFVDPIYAAVFKKKKIRSKPKKNDDKDEDGEDDDGEEEEDEKKIFSSQSNHGITLSSQKKLKVWLLRVKKRQKEA